MYYKAKDIALSNGQNYHLAAILMRGKHVVKIGTNSDKTHPKFIRRYDDGSTASCLHAEMDVLRFSQPGDKVIVLRFSTLGELTMAKPCKFCQQHIKDHKLSKVLYSNWEANLEKLKI